jgi:hypothetical protein
MCSKLNIAQNISTAYHLQTDSQLEWANAHVEQYIYIYGNTEQDDWASLLPLTQYVHNSWENSTTGYTPFELLIGHTPKIHVSHEVTVVPEVEKRQEWLEHVRRQAQAAIKNAQKVLMTRAE